MTYSEILNRTSDDELKEMFLELIKYNSKGILPENSKIRLVRNRIAKSYGDEYFDVGCMLACSEITYEIALRHYNMI
jgi:hypothetical protein